MNRQTHRYGGVGTGVGGFALGAAFTYLLDHPGASPRFDAVREKARAVTDQAQGAVREVVHLSREAFSRSEPVRPPSPFAGGRALAGIAGIGLLAFAALIRSSVSTGIGLAALSLIWRSISNRSTGRLSDLVPSLLKDPRRTKPTSAAPESVEAR
ncbi:MAG: hypothetical protein Q8N23_32550 [Archangium sp.]|nr:hypothetical protein [Archangium sp.]MDP3157444.1 hypothetical protein [Archangium sp.]MDP3572170.1 hypothetical protein [Archangium sp.]